MSQSKTAIKTPGKKTLMTRKNGEKLVDFLLVLPALILLAIFTYYPIAKLVQISFTDWNLLKPTWNYVGLKNWDWLFNGSGAKYLWNSMKVTFVYTMGEITVTIVGGMIFALLFNRATKGFTLMTDGYENGTKILYGTEEDTTDNDP